MSQCYLSSLAEDTADDEAGPVVVAAAVEAGQALFRLIEALTDRHHLGVVIRDGAVSAQLSGGNPEGLIRAAEQEIDRRLAAYRRLQCSMLVGQPYKLAVTGLSIQAEMRNAIRRNDAAAAARAAAIRASASEPTSHALGAPV